MTTRRTFSRPRLLTHNGGGIAFGGDYNHDQWSERLGRRHPPDEAGRCQPVAWRFLAGIASSPPRIAELHGWLDRIIDKLGKAGHRGRSSATATAPLWLATKAIRSLRETNTVIRSAPSWSPTGPGIRRHMRLPCVINSPNAMATIHM